MKWFKSLWTWFARLWRGEPVGYPFTPCNDLPDQLKPGVLYVAGENGHYWAAALKCPCGCGDDIQLNLMPQARPCWSVTRESQGSATVEPSIWRSQGCRSHFWLRRGGIEWVRDFTSSS
jgi:hypothetical protein